MSLLKGIGSFFGGFAIGVGYVIASPFLFVGWIFGEIFPDKQRTGIVIFGMLGSGKTTIFNFLRNEHAGPGTSIRDLDEFEYKLESGKTRIIKKSKDIGGGEEYIRNFYSSMLLDENYDVYFFTFNCFDYVNGEAYQRDVNSRLDYINNKNTLNKKIILIGSYMDKFNTSLVINSSSGVMDIIKAKVKSKSYSGFFNENFVLMDLTNESTLKEFFNQKVFK